MCVYDNCITHITNVLYISKLAIFHTHIIIVAYFIVMYLDGLNYTSM